MDKEVEDHRPEASVLIIEDLKKPEYHGAIVDVIGGDGPWQLLHWFIFCSVSICCSWHTLSVAFIAPYSQCWCISEDWNNHTAHHDPNRNSSMSESVSLIHYHQCRSRNSSHILDCRTWDVDDIITPCNTGGYGSDSYYRSTVVTKWQLFCDKRWYTSLAKSIFMIAAFVSVLLSEKIVRRYGRRTSCFSGYVLLSVCSILTTFSPSFAIFLMLRFFSALGLSALQWITYLAMTESIRSEYRIIFIACSQFAWIIGYMLLPAFVWFSSSWTGVQIMITVPCLIIAAPLSMLPESWNVFLLQGKLPEAEKVLRLAIKMNEMSCQDTKELVQAMHLSVIKSKANSGTIYENLKAKCQKKNICFYSCSFMTSLLYYLLTWNSNYLHGDVYANFAMMGSMEVPSIFLVMFLGIYVQPKVILSASLGITSIVLLIGANIPHGDVFIPSSMFLAAKTIITCAFILVFIHGSGLAGYSSAGKGKDTLFAAFFYLGAAVSSAFDDPIASGHSSIPITILCSISLICSLLAVFFLSSDYEFSCQAHPESPSRGIRDIK